MKKRKPTLGYVCGTDWTCEIPWNRDACFPEIYRTQAALKRDRSCWKECGIYEVEVRFTRVVRKSTL